MNGWIICRYIFNFSKDYQTIFLSDFPMLHFYQLYMTVLDAPCSGLHGVWSAFSILSILTGIEWHLVVVFICISPIVNNTEHLFRCLFTIHMPLLMKSLFKYFVKFLNELCVSLLLGVDSSLYIFSTSP